MKNSHNELRIDGRRLWNSLMELAKLGATEKGGVCRIALTDLDRQGRDLFSRAVPGATTRCRPSPRAATSTRSPRAASSTATTACSPGWR